MSNVRWKGAALAVADVWTIAITADDATTTYKVTINGKVVSVLGSGSGTTQTATNLTTALAASTIPEFAEATWTSATNVVTGTAKTAGIPFTPASSVSGGAGTIGAATNATVATGPNFWNNTANWSTGAVPVAADTVYIENSSVSIQYGLGQSAVTLTALNIAASFTGDIGLPETNTSGSSSYLEYRSQYLAIGSTTTNIGYGPGQGSGRIKLDNGSVQTALNVANTGTSPETNLEAVQWKGTHASNAVNVTKGSIALAGYGGDAATVLTLNVGFVGSQASDSQVRGGAGLTGPTTLNMQGGTVLLAAGGLTTASVEAGSFTLLAGNVTTVTLGSGASMAYLGTGTLTTVTIGPGAALDFSQDMRARTITNKVSMYPGASLNDPHGTLYAASLSFQPIQGPLTGIAVDVGIGRSFAVT